jgi:glycosyltransferase involved in cell wall biosynthesis
MPLVSVIIPCHNSQQWLQETLDSVSAQTWPHLEIILVDDGSVDSTPDIIRQFAEVSPLLVKTVFGTNHGAASARNTGLALAAGEYIQYLDADDLLMPESIALKVKALQESGADVAYCDWQKLQERADGQFAKGDCITHTLEQVDPDPEVALFTTFWSPPVALLYRRSIVDCIGGWKQTLAPIEDARYMLDALFNGARFMHVPHNLALYRLFDGPSHSRRSPLKFVSAVLKNALEVEKKWEAAGKLDDRHRAILADTYGYTARTLFRLDLGLFDEALTSIYRLQPGFRFTWPKIAGVLRQCLGQGLALKVLGIIGKDK